MDRNLALEVVRVTEAAALAAARHVGLGNRDGADLAATEAMRKSFGSCTSRGPSSSAKVSGTRRPCSSSARSWATAHPNRGDRHRRRSAGGDQPVRQRDQRRPGGGRHGRAWQVPERPVHVHGEDRGRDGGRGVIDIRKTATWNLNAIAEARRVGVADLTRDLDHPATSS